MINASHAVGYDSIYLPHWSQLKRLAYLDCLLMFRPEPIVRRSQVEMPLPVDESLVSLVVAVVAAAEVAVGGTEGRGGGSGRVAVGMDAVVDVFAAAAGVGGDDCDSREDEDEEDCI